jgi:hypothetical protein
MESAQGFRGATACIQQRPAIGTHLAGCRFGGGAERRALRPREIEAVTLCVIDLHASGGGHGVPFARGKTSLRKTSIYSVKKGQKSKPKISNGTAKKPHVGMYPKRRFPARYQAREGFFVRFAVPRAEQASRLPRWAIFTEN